MSQQKYAGFLPGAHAIEGYGAGGFRFGGMSHRGSILALPSGIHAWGALTPADIDIASLAAVFAEPRGLIEHLLVGTGLELVPLEAALRQRLRAAGIRAEPMQTGAAARTYSILLGEKRRVAAALLAVP
ncbi:MAG: Mth938-like domain-containing protein [Methylocella sp.]